jgi:RNA polymerase sigma-70 factor (ECF subfamily)
MKLFSKKLFEFLLWRRLYSEETGGSTLYRDGETKVPLVENSGATEAFARIVHEHQRAVFALAYAKLGNVHDAEDVKQEVFVEAWLNMDKLRTHEKVNAWLFKVASNECKEHFRKTSRRGKREAAFVESAENTPPLASDEKQNEAILRAISQLPERFRIVVMLKHFAKLSYDEISKMTGLSKTTIDGRLRIAKKRLRQKLVQTGLETD